MKTATAFSSVYGPVISWRYGTSLGIDPIGPVSTCSFNCVYCQLGEIKHQTQERKVYIPTGHILQNLENFAPEKVDIITLSGSGEPTQAANLGEIITSVKALTNRPILVLTNGSLLNLSAVRAALACADKVSVKLDGITQDKIKRINRPLDSIEFLGIWEGLQDFRSEYEGELGIQTMILSAWDETTKAEYIRAIKAIMPAEIQLNTPTRPKPLKHQLDGRGNHSPDCRDYPVQQLKCVPVEVLKAFAQEITQETGILVRCAPL
ncbi:radical SAM protein [Ancylothrix sp. C2]|uniref:radical SAM protein n=1 Tax=Ancylothrix sp. D3o TaxID=2953691 RepID=UPI0021BAB3A1|nr:radical SAM protein [Ancylothrix sp. D3o]MCT7952469.1 radical SAM protein [Ancylothrix sp. D3o]